MEYIGFADAIKFVEISGISKNDLEKHVYSNKEFQERCMYRFGKTINDTSRLDQQLTL